MIWLLVIFVILFLVSIGGFQLFGRYIYSYRITENSLQIVLFGKVPIVWISLSSIGSIEEISFKDAMVDLFALKMGNRAWGPALRVNRTRGLLRRILISPDNPKEFKSKIESAQSKLYSTDS